MRSNLRLWSATCGILLLVASTGFAQLPQTRLNSLSRVGGQQGSTCDVTITGGGDLEEINELVFSHDGIQAQLKSPNSNSFSVAIGPDVPLGVYEVRCGGLWGFSNPRRFEVGDLPDVGETDNNTPEKPTPLALGTVINGVIDSNHDLDWYQFAGQKGERIIFDCWAERLDSRLNGVLTVYAAGARRRLASARNTTGTDPILVFDVPEDGTYLLKVHDHTYRQGNEYVYRLAARTGPYVEFALPPSGTVGTRQSFTLYGYNLPGGSPSEQSLNGRILESLVVEIDVPKQIDTLDFDHRVDAAGASVDAFSYRLSGPNGVSNPVRIGISPVPVVLEEELNDTNEKAQRIPVPVEIGGQFAVREDNDVFRFDAKKDQVYSIEVFSQRMGVPADPYLIVEQVIPKEAGAEELKRLTAQDDVGTNLAKNVFETNTDDPFYRLQVPADGTYQVTVRDRYWESRGAANLAYRLAIRTPTPDFRLVAIPSAPAAGQTWPISLRKGDHFPVTVLAFRLDGFAGPIHLSAQDLPDGCSAPEVTMRASETSTTMVLTATGDAPVGWHRLAIDGTAEVDTERSLTRRARAGTIVWSTANNVPAISRLSDALAFSIMKEPAPFQVTAGMHQVVAHQSRQVLIPVQLEKRTGFDEKVTLEPQGLAKNANIDLPKSEIPKGQAEQTLRLFVKDNSPPGFYTLWLKSQGQVAYARNPEKAERLKQANEQAKQQVEAAKQAVQSATEKKQQAAESLKQSNAKQRRAQEKLAQKQAVVESMTQRIQKSQQAVKETLAKSQQTQESFEKANALLKSAQRQLASLEQALKEVNAERRTAQEESAPSNLEALKKAVQALVEAQNQLKKTLSGDQLNQRLSKLEVIRSDLQQEYDAALKFTQAANKKRNDIVSQVAAAKVEHERRIAEQQTAQKTADAAQATYESARKAAQEMQKQMDVAVADAARAMKDASAADGAVQAATEVQKQSEAAEKMAQTMLAEAEKQQKAAEKAATDAANAAKPKNTNFTPPSTPIVIEVKPAPVKLAAAVPDGGTLKRGGQLPVKVTVTRQNGFEGPVSLSLPEIPGMTGVSADAPKIPADQSEGTITISATGEAPEGQLAHVVIQAQTDFGGEALVDVPVTIKVAP